MTTRPRTRDRAKRSEREPHVELQLKAREEIESAVAAVISSLRTSDDEEVNGAEVNLELTRIGAAVQEAIASADSRMTGLSGSPLRRRLFSLLRSELIRRWSEAKSSPRTERVVPTLVALERVWEVLEPEEDPDFGGPLAGPNGLDLVTEVAHDLQSPLTSILTLADALRRGQSGDVNENQRRQLGLIYSAALALSSTASDVSELAYGGNYVAEERGSLSILDIFESVRDIVEPMAEQRGLKIRLEPPEGDRRLGYPSALSRVLLNLTTNALKFTDSGHVKVSAKAIGPDRVEFSVRDTGPGIAPEAMAKLYRPFSLNEGPTGRRFSRTGLGLVICRRLLEAMDSELKLETQPGWGTRFSFELQLPPDTDIESV